MPKRLLRENQAGRIRTGLAASLLCAAAVVGAQSNAEPLAANLPGAAPLCTPDEHTLCLNQARFSVTVEYQLSPTGPVFQGSAVSLTDQTGYFWFFDPNNVEIVVKVLNGCSAPPFDSYWFFASGLTHLGVTITVRDLRTDTRQVYTSDVGTPFQAIQDTVAFRTCP